VRRLQVAHHTFTDATVAWVHSQNDYVVGNVRRLQVAQEGLFTSTLMTLHEHAFFDYPAIEEVDEVEEVDQLTRDWRAIKKSAEPIDKRTARFRQEFHELRENWISPEMAHVLDVDSDMSRAVEGYVKSVTALARLAARFDRGSLGDLCQSIADAISAQLDVKICDAALATVA
jgi:hypothetical protein